MMKSLTFKELGVEDSHSLSRLLSSDEPGYSQFFNPFKTDVDSIRTRLSAAIKDRYWGIYSGDAIVGMFMLRGMDQGYNVPAFGVYISSPQTGNGLATLALRYCISWCKVNDFREMMLSVHQDNPARLVYERNGFVPTGAFSAGGQPIYRKELRSV